MLIVTWQADGTNIVCSRIIHLQPWTLTIDYSIKKRHGWLVRWFVVSQPRGQNVFFVYVRKWAYSLNRSGWVYTVSSHVQNRKTWGVFFLFSLFHYLSLHFLFSFKLIKPVMLKVLSCSVVIGPQGSIQQNAERSEPSAIKHVSAYLKLRMRLDAMGTFI